MSTNSLINESNMEEAIAYKARLLFPSAWNLAVNTEDEELFDKVWLRAKLLVIDDILASFLDQGMIEVAGMTEQGEMMFTLKKVPTP